MAIPLQLPEHRVGMFSTSISPPFIGSWIDSDIAKQKALGLIGPDLGRAVGQAILSTMKTFHIILIVDFTLLFFWQKGKQPAVSAAH